MGWTGDVVTFLSDAKRSGVDFQAAWRAAVQKYPPRGPGMGQRQLSLEDEEETLLAFFERAVEDAWFDRRPALRHLSTDLLDVPVREEFGSTSVGAWSG